MSIEERSLERRKRMVAHSATSFEDAEAWDLDFWQSMTPEEILADHTVEIPIALSAQEIIAVQVAPELHYLASFDPFAATLIIVGATEGWPGVRTLTFRFT